MTDTALPESALHSTSGELDLDPAHEPDSHHSPEEIRKEIRVYLTVFAGLAFLTAATVGACYYLQLPIHYAIMVALTIACIKGFLVAGYFMHLLSEKRLIYAILGLTVLFFAMLLLAPWEHHMHPFNG